MLLGCLHLTGGPYAVLQVCAWASMLVTYSEDAGLVQAARDTFSGERPCDLCCMIDAAKKAEGGNEAPILPSVRLKLLQEMLPVALTAVRAPAGDEISISLPRHVRGGHPIEAPAPPTPPPRIA